jgi:hypothetical protein
MTDKMGNATVFLIYNSPNILSWANTKFECVRADNVDFLPSF